MQRRQIGPFFFFGRLKKLSVVCHEIEWQVFKLDTSALGSYEDVKPDSKDFKATMWLDVGCVSFYSQSHEALCGSVSHRHFCLDTCRRKHQVKLTRCTCTQSERLIFTCQGFVLWWDIKRKKKISGSQLIWHTNNSGSSLQYFPLAHD